MKKVHILGNPESTEQVIEQMTGFLANALKTDSIEISFSGLDEAAYIIDQKDARIIDDRNKTDFKDYDLVWFRGKFATVISEAATIASYLKNKDVKHVNSFFSQRRGVGKINQMYLLSLHNLPLPLTVSAASNKLPAYVAQYLAYPVVLKDIHGSHGQQNYLVCSAHDLIKILKLNPDIRFMAQEYIDSEGDYRILFAGEGSLIIHRQGGAGSHLNNTSQGATATLVPTEEFSPSILDQAKHFAEICEYEIAGVDVIIEKSSGQHYFLEINSQPQIATGAFPKEKQRLIGDYFNNLIA